MSIDKSIEKFVEAADKAQRDTERALAACRKARRESMGKALAPLLKSIREDFGDDVELVYDIDGWYEIIYRQDSEALPGYDGLEESVVYSVKEDRLRYRTYHSVDEESRTGVKDCETTDVERETGDMAVRIISEACLLVGDEPPREFYEDYDQLYEYVTPSAIVESAYNAYLIEMEEEEE